MRSITHMTRMGTWLWIALLTASGLWLASGALAAVPHLIRYQGQAMDSKGVPLEGPYHLTFRLYSAETGGTPLWEEKQENVPLTGGHFSILLGQVKPLTTMDWDQPCWLSIQVNGEPELAPRQRITSVPLAIRAERAEQLTVPVTTSTITDDASRLVPSGAIILWDGASCPAGYTRLTSYDGKFLVGSGTAGAGGGSNTHSHNPGTYSVPSHAHAVTIPRAGWGWGGDTDYELAASCNGCGGHNAKSVAGDRTLTTTSAGVAPITGTSASADSRPEFMTILLCKKD